MLRKKVNIKRGEKKPKTFYIFWPYVNRILHVSATRVVRLFLINRADNNKNLLEKIKESGCVVIKFTQWSIPIIKMNLLSEEDIENNNLPEWMRKLETLYQYCNNHSEDHTKEIYQQLKSQILKYP